MGIGKKNGNTTTSASSEDSSGAPSEMAVDLSSSALEAAAQFSGVSSNGTESWERSGVSDAGKSSGDDVPSSQVDTNRQNDQVSEEHTPEGHDDSMDKDDPVEGHDDRTGRDEIYSALEEVNKEPIQPQTPAVSVPDGADTAAAAADEDAEDAATVDMEGDAGMEALEVEEEAETEEEAEAEEEAGPEPEPEPEPEAHVEEPAEEPAEEAPKKKRRRGGLHAVAASTTDTPPPTMLHAKQRKKKTVEEGSGESGAPEPEPESAVAEEDSEEAPVEKKKKKNRKKRLAMETESEGDKGETASSGKEKKSKKRSEAGADADGGARAKEKAPKEPKEPKEKGPKKARSSYIFFSIDQRKDTDISSLGFQEAGKAISENWKAISAEDRSRYDEMAKQDKQRFQREQKAWEAEHGAPEPRAKPKKDKGSKAKASTSSASSSSGKAAKPKAKKGKATKPADDSSEDDEPTTDAPRVSPMPPLELDTLIPRTRYPMRTESIAVGDKIVWVPQAFDTFVSTYDAMLQQLSLSELPDDVSTNLMQLPADGTANGAEVLSITEPETFAPGLKDQLRERAAVLNPAPPPPKVRSFRLDAPRLPRALPGGWLLLRLKRLTLPGEEPSDDMEYNLPMISRAECDVDQHVCDLKQYEASKKWRVGIGSNSQVAVRFAVDSKEEEEWEGRIWDEQPWEPKQYPNSTCTPPRCGSRTSDLADERLVGPSLRTPCRCAHRQAPPPPLVRQEPGG